MSDYRYSHKVQSYLRHRLVSFVGEENVGALEELVRELYGATNTDWRDEHNRIVVHELVKAYLDELDYFHRKDMETRS